MSRSPPPDRFEAIRQQKADLLCEPTSVTKRTLSRRELVDFSIPTFVDGASLMIRADGPHDLKAIVPAENRGAWPARRPRRHLRDTLKGGRDHWRHRPGQDPCARVCDAR